jgi:hypothetical protein
VQRPIWQPVRGHHLPENPTGMLFMTEVPDFISHPSRIVPSCPTQIVCVQLFLNVILCGTGPAAITIGTTQRARINDRTVYRIVGIAALLVLDKKKPLHNF